MKWYFISAVLAAVSIALTAVFKNANLRMIMVIPSLLFFFLTLVIFAVEYDSLMMKQWKQREEKLKKKPEK